MYSVRRLLPGLLRYSTSE
jgi:hypothetical protein